MRRSSDSSWFNKWWNRSLAIVGWHKTKGVPLQVTRVDKVQDQWTADKPINESVMCRAGSEEGVPVSAVNVSLISYRLYINQLFNMLRLTMGLQRKKLESPGNKNGNRSHNPQFSGW